jgi:hypothetical protein
VGELGRVGQAREGVFLGEVAELEGVADEAARPAAVRSLVLVATRWPLKRRTAR